jgi:hypothetical protein
MQRTLERYNGFVSDMQRLVAGSTMYEYIGELVEVHDAEVITLTAPLRELG